MILKGKILENSWYKYISTTSKQALSTPNNPQPINPTQTQNEQPRMMYAPGFNGLQMPAIFQTPYIVFPQPNGTSIIQPLYQYVKIF